MKNITKTLRLFLLMGSLAMVSCGNTPTYDPYTDYDTSAAFLVGTFVEKSFPSDWTYVPDDPTYPDPSWCKSEEPHELKFKLIGMGVISPEFTAHDEIKVAICVESIGKINETITDEGSEHIFQIDAYQGDTVAETLYGDDVSAYHVSEVTFTSQNITKIAVSMVGYYSQDGAKKALGICKIVCFGDASVPSQDKSLSVTYDNLGGSALPTGWTDTDTADTSRIGTYDVDGTEFKVNFTGKWRISTNNKELGAKADPVSFVKSVSTVTVKKITIDYYSSVSCAVYASQDASGDAITGEVETASTNESSHVSSYVVNSAAFAIKVTANAWIYSITFAI